MYLLIMTLIFNALSQKILPSTKLKAMIMSAKQQFFFKGIKLSQT